MTEFTFFGKLTQVMNTSTNAVWECC